MTTSDFDAKARTWDQDPAKIERAARVADAIRAAVTLRPTDAILDYGCGTGLLGFALRPHVGRVTMADTSPEMLAVVGEKIAAAGQTGVSVLKLAEGVPSPLGGPYDLIATLMLLHHVPDTDAILRTFHAALPPGGHLCVADLDTEDGSFHGAGAEVHQGFDRGVLAARLERAGFTGIRFANPAEVVKDGRRYPIFLAVARKA